MKIWSESILLIISDYTVFVYEVSFIYPSVVPHSFPRIGDEMAQLSMFYMLGIYCWRIYNLKIDLKLHLET
jgi:hypothetical protein